MILHDPSSGLLATCTPTASTASGSTPVCFVTPRTTPSWPWREVPLASLLCTGLAWAYQLWDQSFGLKAIPGASSGLDGSKLIPSHGRGGLVVLLVAFLAVSAWAVWCMPYWTLRKALGAQSPPNKSRPQTQQLRPQV